MPQRLEAVDEVHYIVDYLIHTEYHKRYDYGSYHNEDTTVDKLLLRWPRNLMNELVIRFLNIRKYL